MPQSAAMNDATLSLDAELEALTERGLARLRSASVNVDAMLADAHAIERVSRVIATSDFALETLRRQPELLAALLHDDGAAPWPVPALVADNAAQWPELLRRYRAAESTRLVWRDVHGLDTVDDTLAGTTRLAEVCLQTALDALEAEFAQRHGVVRATDGSVQRLVVFGLGKLGGGELNFSSDIDLVYAYPQGGESDGARSLVAEDYFMRLGQRLAKLLDEPTVDGFCHRVDLRLRPFGNAGRVALSFAGMDQYFQREGRDWERYAWLKARAVAGDIDAGERWLESLRPFVYRRYLDYTALDGLREMKAAIAAEVARRELADDIKRGPGGIREIEFLVQALQLIRGGREAALRERRLRMALPALVATRQMSEEEGDAETLAASGFADAGSADGALREFAQFSGVRALSDASRARLDRVLPALLDACARSSQPDAALRRVLSLLQAILRRASYLALLDEQPSALGRLVDVLARSALLSERLAQYPLLLDELLDTRVSGPMPDRDELRIECEAALVEDDPETCLRVLNERRLALSFRVALAALDGRQAARDSVRQLAWLADEVVRVVVQVATRDVASVHGLVAGGRFAVIGYGSLGGEELGFGSDLDLVFLFDAPPGAESDGARPMEAGRWYARLAQKIVALLGAVTAAGRLYDVDVRLRPDGAKGLLVSSLASFSEYQRERAWTWEHQALVRARGVAGDATLLQAFEDIRTATLARSREGGVLRDEVVKMRARMRAELDRSDVARFDLKQGAGGLVDLEFLLQYLVLRDAEAQPALLQPRATPGLIAALATEGAFSAEEASALDAVHATFVADGLACTLDRRPRLVVENAALATARAVVMRTTLAHGLPFDTP